MGARRDEDEAIEIIKTRKDRSMDTDIRYQLVTIRQDQLRAEADAARLAATATRGRHEPTTGTPAAGRPLASLRRLIGASTGLFAVTD
jgi:hypothetical protein